MNWRGVAWELLKNALTYILTGVLGFVAALFFTGFWRSPERNVFLVPLAITKFNACNVDRRKLEAAISHLGPAKEGAPQEHDIGRYLRALQVTAPERPDSQWVVMKGLVPQEFLPQLLMNGILRCEVIDPSGHHDFRYTTLLAVDVGVLINEPSSYFLNRECSLLYEDMEIPSNISLASQYIEVTPLKGPLHGNGKRPQMLLLKESQSFIIWVDIGNAAHYINAKKIGNLVYAIDNSVQVEVIIKCPIFFRGKETIISGHGYIKSQNYFSMRSNQ